MTLSGRDFLKEIDFSPEELTHLIDLAAHLKSVFGSNVTSRLEAYAEQQASGKFAPNWWSGHELRSVVRRESRAAERARAEGQRMDIDTAQLDRLRARIGSDLHDYSRSQGPEGIAKYNDYVIKSAELNALKAEAQELMTQRDNEARQA